MTSRLFDRPPLRAGDPIDLQLQGLGAAPSPARRVPWHVRFGLSWSSGSAPALLLLLVGAALGPRALSVLSPPVLTAIDPALPVALAALGVHLALNVTFTGPAEERPFVLGAALESAVTALVVTVGVLLLLSPGFRSATFHAWLVALACGICAAMSSGLPSDRGEADAPAIRVRNFDALLPLVGGALLLAWVREGTAGAALLIAAQAVALALAVAVAAWLLLMRTSSDTETRILGVASLLLVGGLADYLSLSALFSGVVAGTFWRLVGGPARESIRRDVGYLQHPLLALMLVVAGARMDASTTAWALIGAYPLLRLVGKLAGAWLARRTVDRSLPDDLGMTLISPGIIGVAFAMNAVRAAGPQSDPLLAVVVVGTIASQVVAAFRHPRELEA